jgi:hypothetical protein
MTRPHTRHEAKAGGLTTSQKDTPTHTYTSISWILGEHTTNTPTQQHGAACRHTHHTRPHSSMGLLAGTLSSTVSCQRDLAAVAASQAHDAATELLRTYLITRHERVKLRQQQPNAAGSTCWLQAAACCRILTARPAETQQQRDRGHGLGFRV